MADDTYWSDYGESTFRSLGEDTVQAAERYGFRAFKVMATTTRTRSKFGGKEHMGPLRLASHPMNGRLTGVFRDYLYSAGINVAACQPYHGNKHTTAPSILPSGRPHGCGFYAWGSTGDEQAQVPRNSYTSGLSVHVQAVIAGSGRRVVGTRGFLSERLRIVALAFPVVCTSSSALDRNVYDLFGPALERLIVQHYPNAAIFDSVQRMAEQFPLTTLPTKTDAA